MSKKQSLIKIEGMILTKRKDKKMPSEMTHKIQRLKNARGPLVL